MQDLESLLNRWQTAGVLDAETAARIRTHESQARADEGPDLPNQGSRRQAHIAGVAWQVVTALILGVILLACGVALFVSSHWDDLGPAARLALVLAVVAIFHLAGGFARHRFRGLSTALHAVGSLSVGPAIALVGQIFNLQEHWPSAVLLWAVAAIAGWALLRDQVQQTLALLLIPAWIACELSYYANTHIGADIYLGRLLFTWSVLYLTFFVGSQKKYVQWVLFNSAAVIAVFGTFLMLSAWTSYSATQTFIPFSTRFWAWAAIAFLPLFIAAFHGHKGLVPITAAVAYALVLPWCYRTWVETYNYTGETNRLVRAEPNFLAHALAAAFAVFLCGWGVRLASRALVNFGIVGFAIVVVWFYFSNIYTALGRSVGLIGLGILFLAGGWALEKARRRILAHMTEKQFFAEVQ